MTNVFLSHIIAFYFGEVAEWFKAHAWKACKPFKGFGGSNPPLSASTLHPLPTSHCINQHQTQEEFHFFVVLNIVSVNRRSKGIVFLLFKIALRKSTALLGEPSN